MPTMNLETAPRTIEGMLKLSRPEKYRLALFLEMFAGDDKAEQAFHILTPETQAQALFETMTIRLGGGGGPGSNGSAQLPIMHMQPPPQMQMQMPAMPPMPGPMMPGSMPQPQATTQVAVSRTPVTASDPGNAGSKMSAPATVQPHPMAFPIAKGPTEQMPPQPGAAPIAALQAINGQLKSIMEKIGGLEEAMSDMGTTVESIEETVAGHAKLLQISAMLGVILTEGAMPKMSRREILKMTQLYLNEGELRAAVKQMDEDDEGKD